MELKQRVEALSALAHEGRLSVFRLLARRAPDGVRPSDIADALGMLRNTLSAHLSTLERAGLVASAREGRAVRYSIDLDATAGLIGYLVADCCRGRPELCAPIAALERRPPAAGDTTMTARKLNAIFICTGNSARSILAEAILRRIGGGRFDAFSAGTRPAGEVNPLALAVLAESGHDTAGLRSKNLDEFAGADAPAMDLVFTVCDAAANEECPVWPGGAVTVHWGLPDPAAAEGDDIQRRRAFEEAYAVLSRRLAAVAALPIEELDRMSLQKHLDEIGAAEEPAAIPAEGAA